MGLDFFRRARAAEAGRVPAGMAVERTLQTNGVLLDDEWARSSPRTTTSSGSASTARASCTTPTGTTRAATRSSTAWSPPPAACRSTAPSSTCSARSTRPTPGTRSRSTASSATSSRRATSSSSRSSRSRRRPHDGTARARSPTAACSPTTYGRFLNAIFDEWLRRDVGEMFVQFFDGVLAAYVRGVSSLCVLQPTCGEGVALEHNGDLYSCDHFVDPQLPARQHHGDAARRARPLRAAARLRAGQAGDAARLLPRLRVPLRLQRRVPQEPPAAHARRRARPQLAVRRAQGVLRAHAAADAADGRRSSRAAARRVRSWRCSPTRPARPAATTPAPAAAAGSTSAAAASVVGLTAPCRVTRTSGTAAGRRSCSKVDRREVPHARRQAQHPRPLGRRHRLLEPQLQQPRHDGVPDAQHRPPGARGHRASPTSTASRAAPPAAPPSSPARTRCAPASPRSACPAPTSASGPRTRPSPSSSSPSATRRRSSARTTSATATSTCRPTTASTSSSATSTT